VLIMVIREADRRIARRMFQVAVGLIESREPDIPTRELAHDALHHPSPSTVRALLAAGRGRPWLPSVMDALAQVGIAAAEDVLEGDDHAE
jgi:hypothetical protein